jgi:hypothetical protein
MTQLSPSASLWDIILVVCRGKATGLISDRIGEVLSDKSSVLKRHGLISIVAFPQQIHREEPVHISPLVQDNGDRNRAAGRRDHVQQH